MVTVAFPTMRKRSVIPGFGLTLGITLSYLGLMVIIPLCVLFLQASEAGWAKIVAELSSPRTLSAFRVSFGIAVLAALVNAVFGFVAAWVLVRYEFPGRRFVDSLIDLPFALPTAVAGISLAQLYATNGWLGQWLDLFGVKVAFTPLGILIALIFVGLPFVVRTTEPVLHARLRACHRRVRLGDLHRRQYARNFRNPAAADCDQARAVRLCGRDRAREPDADRLLRSAARDQPAAGLDSEATRWLIWQPPRIGMQSAARRRARACRCR